MNLVKLCKPATYGLQLRCWNHTLSGSFRLYSKVATSSYDFRNFVSSVLVEPSKEVKSCHEPKPVLISTGEIFWNKWIISNWTREFVKQSNENLYWFAMVWCEAIVYHKSRAFQSTIWSVRSVSHVRYCGKSRNNNITCFENSFFVLF